MLHVITRRWTEAANKYPHPHDKPDDCEVTSRSGLRPIYSLESWLLERVLIGCLCTQCTVSHCILVRVVFIRKRDCASNSAGTWVLFSPSSLLSRRAFSEWLPTRTQRALHTLAQNFHTLGSQGPHSQLIEWWRIFIYLFFIIIILSASNLEALLAKKKTKTKTKDNKRTKWKIY